MSGTIPLSMTQQMDQYGDPLSGGRLYFFVAGTVSTFQNAFQDSALTLAHPNPIALDATGRVPQLFLADGLIKIRLTDSAGVVQLVADNVQVIGASSGGGGGGAIDATAVARTGDLKPRYDTGTHSGWVRGNGRTVGSSISGATELADASTQALFEHLWQVNPGLAVSGGRGATALADWNANKQIALPDLRGVTIAGLDDMGNTIAGRLTATYFFTSPTTLGNIGGNESTTLTEAQTPIPNHRHYLQGTASGSSAGSGGVTGSFSGSISGSSSGSISGTASGGISGTASGTTDDDSPDHSHPYDRASSSGNQKPGGGGTAPFDTNTSTQSSGANTRHRHTFTGGVTGSFSGGVTGSYSGGVGGSCSGGITGSASVTGTASVTLGHWSDYTQYLGNTPHSAVQKTMVMTIYIKL
jgi:hypothetical protein